MKIPEARPKKAMPAGGIAAAPASGVLFVE